MIMHFEGVSGSVIVSIIAFSIVFAVLLGLTCMIYAMKLFAGSKAEKKTDNNKPAGGAPAPVAPAAPVAAVAAPAPAPAVNASGVTGQIVAAITAAIIEATNGMGRVMAITPELAADGPDARHCTQAVKRWKSSGVVRLVDSTIDRGWRR